MYIEFRTTVENPLFLVGHIFKTLEAKVDLWAITNEIPYTSKFYKNTFRLAFDDNRHYTVFRLTWTEVPYTEYKIIDNKW